jgi:hypothetical protein
MAITHDSTSLFLEPLLGTDKNNPVFSVYRNGQENKIYLYYGLELLEVIPDQRDHPRLKLMVAQLFNAGVKGTTLIEVFQFDRKTIKSWADALLSGDPERLVRVLEGRRAGRKLTTEVKSFVRFRFQAIYPENRATYSKQIREEILEVFGLSISSEALRPLFNEFKAEMEVSTVPVNAGHSSTPTQTHTGLEPDNETSPQVADAAQTAPDPVPAGLSPFLEDTLDDLKKTKSPSN